MRGLADRWRPRGLRPPVPPGRQILPVALATLAVVAAASTNASGARVTTATALPPATVGVPYDTGLTPGSGQYPGFPGAPSPTMPANGVPGTPGSSEAVGTAAGGLAANGIPEVALKAYRAAEKRLATESPDCKVSWSVIAAIGRVESNHGRFAGATLLADGRSDPPILGIPLDGTRAGTARIADTDGGKYDGDPTYDRAVGPMQFIPSTWALFAVDGDGDGKADPFDVDDVAVAAGRYLCRAGGDLSTETGRQAAVFAYNHSDDYVRLVLSLADAYASGATVDTIPAPDRDPRPIPPQDPDLPPATVGTPPAGTPSATPKPSPTKTTPKPTPTKKPTPSPTRTTPSTSPTSSPTGTPTPTCTPAPTPTGTPTGTPTPTPSPSETPSPTPTPTEPPTGTPTGSPTTSPSPTVPTCP